MPPLPLHWFWIASLAAVALSGAVGILMATLIARRPQRALMATLAESQLRYDHLAEQTSDVVIRMSGRCVHISSSIEAMTGYDSDEVRSMSVALLVHPDDRASVGKTFASLDRQHPRRKLTYRLAHRNGSIVWVEGTFSRLWIADGIVETIITSRDVTAQYEEARELRGAIQAARDAQDAADIANRAKSDFLASMSHEVRTPLSAIIGFADLLMASPDLPATARRHAERIRGGGDALLMIVNDILDVSQAEAGTLRLDPHPFSLPLLVDECLSLVEHSAVDKHLALHVELRDPFPPGVLGDASRLRQIILNLLNNAIKFTPRGSVRLTIGYDRSRDDERILFEITDTGIGIAGEDLPRLFQRFSQVDGSIHRTFGGTGLGLAISKMLVDLMGGAMGVRSQIGSGSTFWFAVELEAASLVLETRAAAPSKPRRRLDVLLVEDTRINQELVSAIVEADGHLVDIVGDGAEAIMAVPDKAYDLVLMDVQMPHVDGLAATRAIRALPSPCRFTPIVAMTANVLKSQIADIRAAGMDDVLSKPLDLDALRAVLDRAARKTIRSTPPKDILDDAVLAKLIGLLGRTKVDAMIETLIVSLSSRFTLSLDADSITVLKGEAHAGIAGSAMLGFVSFATACRRFLEADTAKDLDEGYVDLRAELSMLVAVAQDFRAQTIADRGRLVA